MSLGKFKLALRDFEAVSFFQINVSGTGTCKAAVFILCSDIL